MAVVVVVVRLLSLANLGGSSQPVIVLGVTSIVPSPSFFLPMLESEADVFMDLPTLPDPGLFCNKELCLEIGGRPLVALGGLLGPADGGRECWKVEVGRV